MRYIIVHVPIVNDKDAAVKQTMSAEDWRNMFPSWKPRPKNSSNAADIIGVKRADFMSVTFSPIPWTGTQDIPEELAERVINRFGRWVLLDDAVVCIGHDYKIGLSRLDEDAWFAHLSTKAWLYDPTDLLDVLEAARRLAFPDETTEQIYAKTSQQIQVALDRYIFPFYPSRLLGHHAYLGSHMQEDELQAFCQFLAEQEYVPSKSI